MADPIRTIYAKANIQLVKDLKKYKGRKPYQFHASEASKCMRELYYSLSGFIPAAENARSRGYGTDGDMHHDQVRRILRDAKVRLGGVEFNADGTVKETKSVILPVKYKDTEFTISMRLDGFIFISGRKHVLEIKSLGFWKNKPMAKVWSDTKSEANLLGYLMQNRRDIMFQTHCCMQGTKVYRTYLLIKDRDGCALGLHAEDDLNAVIGGPTILFNQAVWDAMCQRLAAVVRALRLGNPPPAEYGASSYECKYCKFNYLCHGADKRRAQGLQPAVWHPQLGAKTHTGDL